MSILGTVVNALAIVLGGLGGILGRKLLKERHQETILKATGFAVLFLGMAGALSRILTVGDDGSLAAGDTMNMILSLAFGALLGEILNLDAVVERFGAWLRHKTGSDGDRRFTEGFVTASLTVSIGAMGIMGSIQDGIYGDHTVLFAKAVLDFFIVMIMAASMGRGCLFSFLPVAVLQGTMTLLASVLAPCLTEEIMRNLSLVGSILVFCVGINLVWPKTIRVASLLPALLVTVLLTVIL